MTTLAERVTFLINRDFRGNVKAAALYMGLPISTLARIANGAVTNPSINTLRVIADFYGLNIHWLLSGTDTPPHRPVDIRRLELMGKPRHVLVDMLLTLEALDEL